MTIGRYILSAATVLATVSINAEALHSAASQSGSAAGYAAAGEAYLNSGQFEKAIEQYEKAIESAPAEESSYLRLTDLFAVSGLTADAEGILLRGLEAVPGSQRIHYRLGDLYANSGRTRKSLGLFQAASKLDGPLPEELVLQRIGNTLTVLVRFDDALAAYQAALELSPGSVEAEIGLGNVYFRSGRLQKAGSVFSGAARNHPDVVALQYRLAEVDLRLGRYQEAIAAAAKALELDPAHRRSLYLRGTALIRNGQALEGKRDLEEFRRLEALAEAEEHKRWDLSSYNFGAMALLRENRLDEAVELLKNGIRASPDSQSLYLNLGLLQSRLGRHRAAVETFETLIRLGLDGPRVHQSLATEYLALGDQDRSRQHYAIYLEKAKTP